MLHKIKEKEDLVQFLDRKILYKKNSLILKSLILDLGKIEKSIYK